VCPALFIAWSGRLIALSTRRACHCILLLTYLPFSVPHPPCLQGVHGVLDVQGPPPGRARDGRVHPGGQRQDPGHQPLPTVQEQVRAPPHLGLPREPLFLAGKQQALSFVFSCTHCAAMDTEIPCALSLFGITSNFCVYLFSKMEERRKLGLVRFSLAMDDMRRLVDQVGYISLHL